MAADCNFFDKNEKKLFKKLIKMFVYFFEFLIETGSQGEYYK